MTKVRDEGLLRLRNRTTRLLRLLELEAPDVILINESNLVMQAARMLDEQAWVNMERNRLALSHKSELHLCEEDGCDEPVAWRLSEATPTCPGPFHPVCCEKHAKATELAMAAEDDEDEDDDGGELGLYCSRCGCSYATPGTENYRMCQEAGVYVREVGQVCGDQSGGINTHSRCTGTLQLERYTLEVRARQQASRREH